ncbi:sce7725 family protein [Chryseobacterium sp. SL1]|uniref:sce7725 family protein n=1 Tax=Chryseobacterium sp. SL1 TaxID=2995159 RepID=UPI00227289A3|nr:sce7725 family protein [Chryseobacterium sp. SL1]MCY1660415.1 sce7725 family protein [Chryseobacterium sp. SL1]
MLHFGKFSDISFLQRNSSAKYDLYLIKKVDEDYINNTAQGEIVYLEDGFKKQDRNTDYPDHSDFSDLIFKFKEEQIFGFGDFTIISKEVPDGGGSPFAIALHLSKIEYPNFRIYHFISDDNEDRRNQANKFLQALNKLITFIDNNLIFEGEGIKDFRNRLADGHYPGLGICKKMSIKNHIEQVNNSISVL